MILRELFTALGLDVDEASFAKGHLAAELVKASLERLADVAKEVVNKFVEVVEGTAEAAEQIDALAQAAGVSTTELQQLGKAAGQEGMSLDEFSHSLVLLARNMNAAKEGGEAQAKAFRKTGVSVKDANGHLRSAGDVFADLAEHFASLPDGAEKTALSMELFGRSGASMIRVLNGGREEIEKFRSAQVMTPEQIAAGKEMVIVQRQLAAQTAMLWRTAVAPLLPAITDLLKQYLAWKKANNEVLKARITSVLGAAIKVVRALGSAFSATLRVIRFFKDNWKLVVALGIGGATAWAFANAGLIASFVATSAAAVASAAAAAGAWLLAAAPFIAIGAIVAGIFLIFDDLRVYAKGGKSLFGLWESTLNKWLEPRAEDPWWLAAIKYFVRFMERALKLMSDFKQHSIWDYFAPESQSGRTGPGGNLTEASWRDYLVTPGARKWLRDQGVDLFGDWDRNGSQGAPAPTAPAPSAANLGPVYYPPKPPVYLSPTFSATFHTTAAPGQNPEDVASANRAQFDQWYDTKMEEAAAASGG